MKLLKCLCSSATCAQTAQLLSQQVRQARAPSEMRATALASAGGSAAVALSCGCCGRATNDKESMVHGILSRMVLTSTIVVAVSLNAPAHTSP